MERLISILKSAFRVVQDIAVRVWQILLSILRVPLRHPVKAFLVIITAIAVYATLPPAGSILILHRNDKHLEASDRLMRRGLAEANARNFATNHVRKLIDKDYVPSSDLTEKFGIDRIQDVLEASLTAEKKEGFLRGSLGVDITALIQSYVDSYFATPSTILIVDEYIEETDADPNQAPTVVITANRVTTRELGGLGLSESDLISRIANFFIVFFYDIERSCEVEFCAQHFPSSVQEIERVSQIISALSQEKILGICNGIDEELQCIRQIRSELNSIDGDFLVRDVLLLLTEFANLKLAIAQSRAAVEIGDTLDRIHRQLIRVKSIPQFAEISQSEESLQHFLTSIGKDDLELSNAFLTTAEHYQTGRLAVQSGKPLEALASFRKVESPPSWFQGYLSGVTLVHSFDPKTTEISVSLAFIDELLTSDFDAEYIKMGLAGILYRQLVEARKSDLTPSQLEALTPKITGTWSDAVSLTSSLADRLGAQIEQARALHALSGGQEQRTRDLIAELESEERSASFRNAYMSAAMFTSILGWTERTKELLEAAFAMYPRNICAYQQQPDFAVFKLKLGVQHDEWISKQRELYGPPC
ncbi:MAG: hypothetical protein WA782_06135 [Sulfitobacter sp.]